MRARQWRQGFLIGVLLVVALGLVSLIWGLAGKMAIAVAEERSAKKQYQDLENRKNELQSSLAALGTARGQDAAIRTAFGVARPGEEVIVVVPPDNKAASSSQSWWQKILGWF